MSTNIQYKIYEGSATGHCCFEYSVLDTLDVDKNGYYGYVCEMYSKEKAELVCGKLNNGCVEYIDRYREEQEDDEL